MKVLKVLIHRDDLDEDDLEKQVALGLSHLDGDVRVFVEPDEEPEEEEGEEPDESDEEIAACPACGRPLESTDEEEDEQEDDGSGDEEDDYLAAFTGEADE